MHSGVGIEQKRKKQHGLRVSVVCRKYSKRYYIFSHTFHFDSAVGGILFLKKTIR